MKAVREKLNFKKQISVCNREIKASNLSYIKNKKN